MFFRKIFLFIIYSIKISFLRWRIEFVSEISLITEFGIKSILCGRREKITLGLIVNKLLDNCFRWNFTLPCTYFFDLIASFFATCVYRMIQKRQENFNMLYYTPIQTILIKECMIKTTCKRATRRSVVKPRIRAENTRVMYTWKRILMSIYNLPK